jgi:hypothetical protein
MNKLRIILISTTVAGLAIPAFALHSSSLPQPQFNQVNFLRLDEPLEFNLDYALVWTDSAAGYFSCLDCSQAGPPDCMMYIS